MYTEIIDNAIKFLGSKDLAEKWISQPVRRLGG